MQNSRMKTVNLTICAGDKSSTSPDPSEVPDKEADRDGNLEVEELEAGGDIAKEGEGELANESLSPFSHSPAIIRWISRHSTIAGLRFHRLRSLQGHCQRTHDLGPHEHVGTWAGGSIRCAAWAGPCIRFPSPLQRQRLPERQYQSIHRTKLL